MRTSNFTPISGKKLKKNKSSVFRVMSLITLFVMLVGVGVGYVMVQQGFNFKPKAASVGGHLARNGWDGRCFQNTSLFRYGARYQCPGRIGNYPQGCQGAGSNRTGAWQYNSVLHPLGAQGQSNVCTSPTGNDGPKDANGCFTQQLDVDDGSGGSPEGFYSFDSCASTPTDPKPPTPTTCDGGLYCDGSPVVNSTIGQIVCGGGDANWSGYNWQCGTDGKWFPLHTTCNMCVVTPTSTPTPTPTETPEITSTPTPTPSPTPTPTPPACIEPEVPANVRINCPLCSQLGTQ